MNGPGTNSTAPAPPLLKVESVSKSFGGIHALRGVSFEVREGDIHAVIGPNGAGKTTLFNVITGAYNPERGMVTFEGREIQGGKIHQAASRGIARTFQNVELFGSMSVLENVLVGGHVRTKCGFPGAIFRWPWARKEEREAVARAMELLEFAGIADIAGNRSADLPFGWQRFVEIARALASQPRLLLLDEPAAGLNGAETQRLGELMRSIRDRGITLLLVEHDMNLTMEISDRLLVLNQGAKLAEGTPREIQANEAVMEAYLGRE
ncbi:MAG: ABC transporter ATP-binding protein [Syntrophobacteraceae bacterium]